MITKYKKKYAPHFAAMNVGGTDIFICETTNSPPGFQRPVFHLAAVLSLS